MNQRFGRIRRVVVAIVAIGLVCQAASADDEPVPEGFGTRHRDQRGTPRLEFLTQGGYRPKKAGARGQELARMFLEANAERYKFDPRDSEMRLRGEDGRASLTGVHYSYDQFVAGIRVLGGGITVTLDPSGESVLRAFNTSYPASVVAARTKAGEVAIGEDAAMLRAWNYLNAGGALLAEPSASLRWLPQVDGLRLVYLVRLSTTSPFGSWEIGIDAIEGAVVWVRNAQINEAKRLGDEIQDPESPPHGVGGDFSAARIAFAAKSGGPVKAEKTTVGSALVFDPNPRTTLAMDTLAASSPAGAFTGAYKTVSLLELATLAGRVYLQGPWVRIADLEPPFGAPSTTSDGVWSNSRGQSPFYETMCYFHIDQSQRYIQSLGFTPASGRSILAWPIEVDADGVGGADNSHFDPSVGMGILAFGHGGCVPDNEDADVILHEYGHAIQHAITGEKWRGGDTGAMGEGFGDYWATSYRMSTKNGATFRLREVFPWDGNAATCWPGRRSDRTTLRYDSTRLYPAHASMPGGGETDELWSTPLVESLVELVGLGVPRREVDTIVLESHFGLASGARMPDLALSTIAAAKRLFPEGPHAGVFKKKFQKVEILPPDPTVITPPPPAPADAKSKWPGFEILMPWMPDSAGGGWWIGGADGEGRPLLVPSGRDLSTTGR